jgi:hypothetical protein
MQGLKAIADLLTLQQTIELEKGVDVQAYNAFRAGITDATTGRTALDVYSQAETDSEIDGDIATHSALTTSIHGITDTANLMLKVGSAADNRLVKLNADGTLSNAGNDVYFEVDAQGLSFVPSLSRSNTITRVGSGAGFSNTTGINWTAIGFNAGRSSTTGENWTAIGRDAGRSNTTGVDWVAIGLNAGRSNITGNNWVAIGLDAGFSNTTGVDWVAIGLNAGRSNTTGISWTAVGVNAGYSNTTGVDWVAIGREAGFSNTTGSSFTAIGVNAGRYVGASGTTPNETCTTFFALGNNTRLSADGTTNEGMIGNDALGRGSNTLQIGSTAMTEIGLGDIAIFVDTAPSSSTDTGEAGMVAFDADYIYRCTATDTWKRSALATW